MRVCALSRSSFINFYTPSLAGCYSLGVCYIGITESRLILDGVVCYNSLCAISLVGALVCEATDALALKL